MGSKVCTKCKETKDYSEYGYRKEGKLHLQSHCKKCQAISALATKKKTDPIVIKNRQHKSRENNIIRNTDEIISSKLNLKKICRFCNKLLFFKEFGVDKTRADGFVSKCRTCVNEADRTRYSVNRDSLRARKLDYQKSNPDIYIEVQL